MSRGLPTCVGAIKDPPYLLGEGGGTARVIGVPDGGSPFPGPIRQESDDTSHLRALVGED